MYWQQVFLEEQENITDKVSSNFIALVTDHPSQEDKGKLIGHFLIIL